jgi:hypothetical protein
LPPQDAGPAGAAGGKAAESADLIEKGKKEERGKAAPSDDTKKGRPVGAALFWSLADLAGVGG